MESEILQSIVGKTIEVVTVNETFEENGNVSSFGILFTDGSTINVGCTSYNYGGQNLIIQE